MDGEGLFPLIKFIVFIKAQTGDNTTANLMAHALLGAIEAKATGTNALAGAAGALTGEAAAQIIAQKLYGIDGKSKTTNDLNESEKQTITALSQLAGGSAGGIIGDSTTSAVSSADIAKRAVENNLLSHAKSEKLIKYMDLLDEKGKLTFNQLDESKKLLDEHNYIDLLIKQHQKNPDLLNENQKSYLREKLSEIALDLVKQNNHRLSFNEALNELYNWDFTQPQIGADYSKLTSEIKRNAIVTDNLDQKLGKSTLEAGLLIGSSPSTLLKGVSFIENTAVNLSGKALGIAPKLEGTLANMANDLRYISSEGIYYANNPALLAQGGINTVTNYLNKTTKMMAETPIKVAVTNGIAAATVKAGFEGYDYYSGKPLTRENIYSSVSDVAYTSGLALTTSNIPFVSNIVISSIGDKFKDGSFNLIKNTSLTTIGSNTDLYLDKIVPTMFLPYGREFIIQSIERMDSKGESNE